MFLRCSKRVKDGKEHLYWSVVENRRISGNRTLQRQVLYLGELNGNQEAAWRKSVELFCEDGKPRQALLFPEDQAPTDLDANEPPIVRVRLSQMRLERSRQWGACWLACELWEQLGLGDFWREKLPPGRKGARWDQILQILAIYRLVDPGSEWRLNRQWFDSSAMADLLGGDFALAELHRLYECHDRILEHRKALFDHLTQRWQTLFQVKYEILLYDLTSTYFESDPPEDEGDIRRFGYSRDKRSDCVQVVIALVVTPEGFPIAYEVLPGNTSDKSTLKDFLQKIETQYGKSDRVWIMDRGIPTEETLELMRTRVPPVSYLVGTPKASLNKLEKSFAEQSWVEARPAVKVKLLNKDGETYVLAQSEDRIGKERSMRRRRLRKYLKTLAALKARKTPIGRDALHQAIGAAKKDAGRDSRHVEITVTLIEEPKEDDATAKTDANGSKPRKKKPKEKKEAKEQTARIEYRLDRAALRQAWRREGRYVLRTNLCGKDPAKLWESYILLTEIEQAFKELKGDLAIRPIYHQLQERIEAHIFISFLAYCLQVTLKARLKQTAGGLTPRAVLEKFADVKMLDVYLPTTDGREIVLTRHTQPEKELQLLLDQLKLQLPEQAPPKIEAPKRA